MNQLLTLLALPLTAAILAAGMPSIKIIRKAVPALFWVQIPVLLEICQPILRGQLGQIALSVDFSIDRLSALFLLLTAFVGASSLSHAEVFFEREATLAAAHKASHERIFYCCSALFLCAMSLIFVCDNLGILWVSVEATTLSSAALVYFPRTKRSLEATWKYLIICSVGIAFALLGTIFIFASSQHGALPHGSLNYRELLVHAGNLEHSLLKFGFIFCLVGYGTKAGVFPLHSWLPDAHSEAPAPASAMLSGSLLNCALFAIFRLSQIVASANQLALAHQVPLVLGLTTAMTGALFLVHQHGLKRLWAYSSIENVGIMLVAIGLGSGQLFFLQALNHSICKVALFLLSGNVVQAAGTKELSELHGILSASPSWGVLLGLAAFAVTGAPPFGAFVSEWLILATCWDQGHWLAAISLIVALAVSFVAVSLHVAGVLFGTPSKETIVFRPFASSAIPTILVTFAIATGITALPQLIGGL